MWLYSRRTGNKLFVSRSKKKSRNQKIPEKGAIYQTRRTL
jgi:hypothetical protein